MKDIAEIDSKTQSSSKRSRKKLLIFIILAVIGLSGYYGYKAYKQYKFNKQWQSQNEIAEANALEYVRDKYAIDAKVVSFRNDVYKDESNGDYWITKLYNTVTLESDGHKFNVIVKWKERSSDGYDNYYTDEVEELLKQQLSESCHGEPVYTNISEYSELDNNNDMWGYIDRGGVYLTKDEHFDGSDLKGVLKDCNLSVDALAVDTVFDDCELFDMFAQIDADAVFYSFDTMEHLEAAREVPGMINGNDIGLMKYAPYITDYRSIHDGKNVHRDFGVKTKDDMLFMAFPDGNSESDTYTYDKVIIGDRDTINSYYDHNKLSEYLSSPITDGYIVNEEYKWEVIVCVYYPLEKLKDHDIEDVGLAWAESTTRYAIIPPDIVDDYAVFFLNPGEAFKLVDTKGLEPLTPKLSY
ncbi:MAG: hypothetical protein IJJ76_07300 [Ruminococcus sp.]|uniref:hypothetical protein n=1 Tax=Ruminococcus sp. TaxID=41978 RepID=UPI0025DC7E70|nr:hypothetical protein [Ruminococcus sp.]MBR0529551.1 hypothetical protein [Ruminococcus sp.]